MLAGRAVRALGRPAAGEVGLEPGRARRGLVGGQHPVAPAVDVDDRDPGGADDPAGVHDDRREQRVDVVGADELGGGLERVEAGIVEGVGDGPHLFHGHAVDLAHLGDEQVDERVVGKLDHELVDGLATITLEDVDAHDVAAHGADAGGHLAQSTGPIGQPHPDHERFHAAHRKGDV